MSLRGDMSIIRNGRSTSQISIYNYPEHLNPFYEDDNHKRLRFWKTQKKDGMERRSSFSLENLRNIWSFKSFSMKKKSSTLGINKTSESPPMLRRYDMNRNTIGPILSNRTGTHRSSLPEVNTPNTRDSGMAFNRNDHTRNTIQFAGYRASQTPQPIRSSFASANPFENENSYSSRRSSNQMDGKRTYRKNRRAPPPPSNYMVNSSEIGNRVEVSKPSSENTEIEAIDITTLTNEIKQFVNTSAESEDQLEQKIPKSANVHDDRTTGIQTGGKSQHPISLSNSNIHHKQHIGEKSQHPILLSNSSLHHKPNSVDTLMESEKKLELEVPVSANISDDRTIVTNVEEQSQCPLKPKRNSDESAIYQFSNDISMTNDVNSSKQIQNVVREDVQDNKHSVFVSNRDELKSAPAAHTIVLKHPRTTSPINIVVNRLSTFQQNPTKCVNTSPKGKYQFNRELPQIAGIENELKINEDIEIVEENIVPVQAKESQVVRQTVSPVLTFDDNLSASLENLNVAAKENKTHDVIKESLKNNNSAEIQMPVIAQNSEERHNDRLGAVSSTFKSFDDNLNRNESINKSFKKKSVKEIIDSITRSQQILNESAAKGTKTYSTLILEEKNNASPNNVGSFNIKSEPLKLSNNSPENDCLTGIQKSKIHKVGFQLRESSPTTSNLDWNPVPKPKRNINI
ncbi:uncharacterized protein LOC115631422 [Scaptodrosophila lebanonensis]|uniref:Uncharacterized protein LOC115631422 n=1 Tax=Drosophila lebanonensis TaxID=7225 RepID=A0A6J2U8Y3_DROLE|nr:uncharacterized protein LOC115631422 [Scaptodrosophila lebanonensis]XP_030384009.1 uncharacterized protein LOC115631422 [Scaptodrosophila lebanonensis]XP_030384010.1 uncharacterized protein LOC115631422 [Scaptodrosophila lebanonensis]